MLQLLFVIATLALIGPAHAAERLAVLELSSKSLNKDEVGLLTDTVRGAVVAKLGSNVKVMTRENMEVMLSDMGLDASCVSEGACEVDTARNLGVDYVVSGSIVGLGGLLVASLKLHETREGTLISSVQYQGADAVALLNGLPQPSKDLVGAIGSKGTPAPKPYVPPGNSTAAKDAAAAKFNADAKTSGPPGIASAAEYVKSTDKAARMQFYEANYRETHPKILHWAKGDREGIEAHGCKYVDGLGGWKCPGKSKKEMLLASIPDGFEPELFATLYPFWGEPNGWQLDSWGVVEGASAGGTLFWFKGMHVGHKQRLSEVGLAQAGYLYTCPMKANETAQTSDCRDGVLAFQSAHAAVAR